MEIIHECPRLVVVAALLLAGCVSLTMHQALADLKARPR
jgi:outer membrane murein-binding lipoprotein Lpp